VNKPLIYRWESRTLSIGRASLLEPHSHAAAEIVLSLSSPVLCQFGLNDSVSSVSLLIPPGIEHQNIHRDEYCPVLYLDPEGRDYAAITQRLGNPQGVTSLGILERRLRQLMSYVYEKNPEPEQLERLLNIEFYRDSSSVAPQLDERIETVARRVKANLSIALSAQELAESVGLSTDRMLHLFKKQIGVPLRRYRTWLRLREASRLLYDGHNMTYAAHHTGFVDSAHFSKAYRGQFGVSPRGMKRRNNDACIKYG